jgi:hypothetical protein
LISPVKQARVRDGSGFSTEFPKESVPSLADTGRKIRITVGAVQVEAELKGTKTAQEVYAALPVDVPVNTWGE